MRVKVKDRPKLSQKYLTNSFQLLYSAVLVFLTIGI
nr:MAG TPA: hypothetical protein [Caudoviricetes sp.]